MPRACEVHIESAIAVVPYMLVPIRHDVRESLVPPELTTQYFLLPTDRCICSQKKEDHDDPFVCPD